MMNSLLVCCGLILFIVLKPGKTLFVMLSIQILIL